VARVVGWGQAFEKYFREQWTELEQAWRTRGEEETKWRAELVSKLEAKYEEEKGRRCEMERRLEAMTQAIADLSDKVGGANGGRGEAEGQKAVERGSKRAMVDSGSARHGERGEALADKASENGEAPAERAIATRKEGLAPSQHAPRKTQAEKPAVKILKRPAVDNRTDQPTSEAASPIPGYGAVHKPQGTCTKKGGDDGFQIVGRGGRVAKETVADELGPIKRGNTEDARKVIFSRDGYTPHPEGSVTAIASAVSIALFKVGTPDHIRLWSLRKNENGVLTGLVKERTNAEQFLKYHDTILLAARRPTPE
jgi:ribosomal protein L18